MDGSTEELRASANIYVQITAIDIFCSAAEPTL